MSEILETTGERMIEESYRQTLAGQAIYLMHVASYDFVLPFCRNRRVLDLGCGSGYGAARVAEVATSVHAVDVSPEAVAYASKNYARPNTNFSVIHPDADLPFADGQFDVVLSFQVLEHVRDHGAYLVQAARVLAEGGTLVLITPDRRHRLLPGQRPWNRWHLREYGARELRGLVSRSFDVERLLYMEADGAIGRIELGRYRLLKWATLPFTLPGLPERLRQWGLGLFHRLQGPLRKGQGAPADASLGAEAVRFVEHSPRSLNLLVVAHPRRRPSGQA